MESTKNGNLRAENSKFHLETGLVRLSLLYLGESFLARALRHTRGAAVRFDDAMEVISGQERVPTRHRRE
jgi:hypothetical protein